MQNNSPFSNRPPLPTPDGNVFPPDPVVVNNVRNDWKIAPLVVRGWDYIVTWLALIILPFVMVAGFSDEDSNTGEKIGGLIFVALIFAMFVWLNRALKNGKPAAWTAQIVVSVFGLLGFPLGTAVHAYILSQWFKPETKAWFGKS